MKLYRPLYYVHHYMYVHMFLAIKMHKVCASMILICVCPFL